MIEVQPSRLLASLFEQVEPGSRLTVFNIGPALPETISFFSNYHCKLHIVDLMQEGLPTIDSDLEAGARAGKWRDYLHTTLSLPDSVRFDLIFFWDVLNFMNREAISALMDVLHPHLHLHSKAHCFAVHNTQTPPAQVYYGISDAENLSRRQRPAIPSNYQPHPQAQLVALLRYFKTDRSVLMSDRRLEILLKSAL